MATGMEGRLEVDAADCGMADGEFDNPADLVIVDPTFDGGNQRYVQPGGGKAIECSQFLFKKVRLASNHPIRLSLKTIKLEVKGRANFCHLLQKTVVVSNPLPVRVHHDKRDAASMCCTNKIDNLWMDGRLAAGELDDLGIAFCANVVVEHRFYFFQRQTEARLCIREAERAVHIAGAVHFNDAQACVLLMVRTKAAIVRTTVLDRGTKCQRNRTGLIEFGKIRIGLGIAVDERLEGAAVRTPLGHIHFVVAQQDLGVDDPAAIRTDAASQLVEDVVSVPLCGRDRSHRRRGAGAQINGHFGAPEVV